MRIADIGARPRTESLDSPSCAGFDFHDSPEFEPAHLSEAVNYRMLDRQFWS